MIHVDGFGKNPITNVRRAQIERSDAVIEIAGRAIAGFSESYATGPDLLAIIGSSGHLEIAARNGSAARELSAEQGTPVMVRLPASS